MRKTIIKIACVALAVAVLAACAVACDGLDPRISLDSAFTANIEGEIDGREISARVYCDLSEHITKEIYVRMSVSLLSPESLRGVTLTLRSDGKASARLGQNTVEGAYIDGMIAPFLASFPDGEYSSVEKGEEGFLAIWRKGEDTVEISFDINGVPKSAKGYVGARKISFVITNFCEKGK